MVGTQVPLTQEDYGLGACSAPIYFLAQFSIVPFKLEFNKENKETTTWNLFFVLPQYLDYIHISLGNLIKTFHSLWL